MDQQIHELTYGRTDRQTSRKTSGHIRKGRNRQADGKTDRWVSGQTDRERSGRLNTQNAWQTHQQLKLIAGQTHRQTDMAQSAQLFHHNKNNLLNLRYLYLDAAQRMTNQFYFQSLGNEYVCIQCQRKKKNEEQKFYQVHYKLMKSLRLCICSEHSQRIDKKRQMKKTSFVNEQTLFISHISEYVRLLPHY